MTRYFFIAYTFITRKSFHGNGNAYIMTESGLMPHTDEFEKNHCRKHNYSFCIVTFFKEITKEDYEYNLKRFSE